MSTLDTKQLIGIREQMPLFTPFFLQQFFRDQINFETEEVAFDRIKKGVKLAPFVSPMVSGRVQTERGSRTTSLAPAYLKPKHVVKPKDLIKRRAGEALNGSMGPAERRLLKIAELLVDQEMSISAREEWMAVQAVMTGQVLIEGEEYEPQVVDFGRRAQNNIALVGAATWDSVDPETYDPTSTIEAWAENASLVSEMIVFSSEAWTLFSSFKSVKEKLDTRRGSASEMELGPQLRKEVSIKGYFGEYLCVVYKGKYEDNDGNEYKFMPAGTVLLAPMENNDVRCYGAILDAEAIAEGGMVAESRYPKNWTTKEPSVEYVMTQSAPLPSTIDPDAYVAVTVI